MPPDNLTLRERPHFRPLPTGANWGGKACKFAVEDASQLEEGALVTAAHNTSLGDAVEDDDMGKSPSIESPIILIFDSYPVALPDFLHRIHSGLISMAL